MNKELYTGYNKSLTEFARHLRKNMTPQKKRLWFDFLRTYPVKFYRQRPIDCYIADFYCSKAKLVIEIDGSQHYTQESIENDSMRTEIMVQYGLTVIRFKNKEIDLNFDFVRKTIERKVEELLNSSKRNNAPRQNASPERGGAPKGRRGFGR